MGLGWSCLEVGHVAELGLVLGFQTKLDSLGAISLRKTTDVVPRMLVAPSENFNPT
jgi:hypothetical protein